MTCRERRILSVACKYIFGRKLLAEARRLNSRKGEGEYIKMYK